jgi:hypothetical protein
MAGRHSRRGMNAASVIRSTACPVRPRRRTTTRSGAPETGAAELPSCRSRRFTAATPGNPNRVQVWRDRLVNLSR